MIRTCSNESWSTGGWHGPSNNRRAVSFFDVLGPNPLLRNRHTVVYSLFVECIVSSISCYVYITVLYCCILLYLFVICPTDNNSCLLPPNRRKTWWIRAFIRDVTRQDDNSKKRKRIFLLQLLEFCQGTDPKANNHNDGQCVTTVRNVNSQTNK